MKIPLLSCGLAALLMLSASAGEFPKGSPPFQTQLTNLKSALAEGKKEGKPVIVIYSAVWCGPCQEMKHEVYPSRKVKPFHDKFVWVYLDFDAESNQRDEKRYRVEEIPNILFFSPGGKAVDQQIGTSSPGEFADKLNAVLKKTGSAPSAGKR